MVSGGWEVLVGFGSKERKMIADGAGAGGGLGKWESGMDGKWTA